MLDSKYLYDTDIKEHGNKPYSYVLVLKIHLAHKLMKKLVIDQDMRDFQRKDVPWQQWLKVKVNQVVVRKNANLLALILTHNLSA